MKGWGTVNKAVKLGYSLTGSWVIQRAVSPPLHAVWAMPPITESFEGELLCIQRVHGSDDGHKVKHGFRGNAWDRCGPYVVDSKDRGHTQLKPCRFFGCARSPVRIV